MPPSRRNSSSFWADPSLVRVLGRRPILRACIPLLKDNVRRADLCSLCRRSIVVSSTCLRRRTLSLSSRPTLRLTLQTSMRSSSSSSPSQTGHPSLFVSPNGFPMFRSLRLTVSLLISDGSDQGRARGGRAPPGCPRRQGYARRVASSPLPCLPFLPTSRTFVLV